MLRIKSLNYIKKKKQQQQYNYRKYNQERNSGNFSFEILSLIEMDNVDQTDQTTSKAVPSSPTSKQDDEDAKETISARQIESTVVENESNESEKFHSRSRKRKAEEPLKIDKTDTGQDTSVS